MNSLSSCGGVRIHLHHTTRTIQVQGSHIMPNKERSAIWFLNNVILNKFKDLAKVKHYVINNTNKTILEAKTTNKQSSGACSSTNLCQACYNIFDSKSRPSMCSYCKKYFHKTKCLKDHSKACTTTTSDSLSSVSAQTSSTPMLSSAVSQSSDIQAVPAVSDGISNLALASSSSSHPSSSRSLDTSVQSGVNSHPSRIHGLQTLITYVPQTSTMQVPPTTTTTDSLSSSISTPVPFSTAATNPNQQRAPPNKRKQKLPPTTPDQAKIYFLETELSAAQARIVVLDKASVDKDQELAVLWARIKILEEKQNQDILNKYSLNNQQADSQTSSSCTSQPPTSPSTCCCRSKCYSCTSPPSSCYYRSTCSAQSNSQNRSHHCCLGNQKMNVIHEDTSKDDLKNAIFELKTELMAMKTTLDNIASKPDRPQPQTEQNIEAGYSSEKDASFPNLPSSPNDSVATIEEFLPDISAPTPSPSNHLNLQNPTNQSQMLML